LSDVFIRKKLSDRKFGEALTFCFLRKASN
jgi:hypothetical protein